MPNKNQFTLIHSFFFVIVLISFNIFPGKVSLALMRPSPSSTSHAAEVERDIGVG